MVESLSRRLVVGLVLGGISAASFGLVRQRQTMTVAPPVAIPRSAIANAILEAPQGTSFTETVVIYVGSSQCIWAKRPSLRASVQSILDSLQVREARRGGYVTAVGIDLAPLRGQELDHLHAVAAFDQFVLGGDVLSRGLSHIADLESADASQTPQIFILTHRAEKVSARGAALVVDVTGSTLLVRKVGLEEIKQWVASGVSVPATDSL